MKRKKQLLALLLIVLLTIWTAVACAETSGNLLRNAGFEELDGKGLPQSWHTDGYITAEGYTQFELGEDAYEGTHSAAVRNIGMNDARFSQTVTVEPDSDYRFSGYIKAVDIGETGWGANLSVDGVYITYQGFYDTDGEWVYSEIYGHTGPEQTSITVYARLGGYSGESSGLAMFDQLCLEKVNKVPATPYYNNWYSQPQLPVLEPIDSSTPEAAKPFWPWLLVLTAIYMAGIVCITPYMKQDERQLQKDRKGIPLLLMLGMAAAFGLRYYVALHVDGYQVDVGCFKAWAQAMAVYGPGQFYQNISFCDYPPAYLYILQLNELFGRLVAGMNGGFLPSALRMEIIIKLVPMLCDLAIAWLTYHAARYDGKLERRAAALLGLAMAFNPVLILTSAAWCQVDAVTALLLGLVVYFAMHRNWIAAFPIYVLVVLAKPQSLMLGPLGLFVILMQFVTVDQQGKPKLVVPQDWKKLLIGAGTAVAAGLIIILPFVIGQGSVSWLFDKYRESLQSYDYATLNTANLHYLWGGNWAQNQNPAPYGVTACLMLLCMAWGLWTALRSRKTQRKLWWAEAAVMGAFAAAFLVMLCLRTPWGTVGYVAMALAFAITMLLYVRAGKLDALPMVSGLLFLLLYVLGVKMHERYLFPAIMLFALAYAKRRDMRTLLLLALCSCTMFVNAGIVLDNSIRLGSSMGHLNNDTQWLNMTLSVLNVLAVPLVLSVAYDTCYDAAPVGLALWQKTGAQLLPEWESADLASYKTDAGLHWRWRDTAIMLGVTLVYAVVALVNLGSTKAPQTTWRSTNAQEQIIVDLGDHYDDAAMLYYCRVSYSDFSVATSDDMETWSDEYWAQMAEGLCYRWMYLMPSYISANGGRSYSYGSHLNEVQRISGRYVRISAQQVNLALNEVIFRDAEGNRIAATIVGRTGENDKSTLLSDPQLILDEQDSLEGEPSWYNGTYFDEIYHARTAMEMLEGTYPYENTHPPLGKLMMSVCVAIFGMTPFGWRFAGCLMGILMLPALYVLGKQLTKRTGMATVAMLLMALDCMHFTQTRIATIDSFPVLFIILAFLFMVRFMQRDIVLEPVKKLLPDLALSGFFMGVGIASKWIVMYAGAGLAVLYFWTCIRHLRLAHEARTALAGKNSLDDAVRAQYEVRAKQTFKRVVILCLWCVLFFIIIPLIVYVLSFVPTLTYAQPLTIPEFFDRVMRMQYDPDTNGGMYGYHSTPGLGMDHPFYSPWYEWPVMKRPMYYAMAQFMPAGYSQSIFCFGNPAVWFVGILGFAVVVFKWLGDHVYRRKDRLGSIHLLAPTWEIAPAMVLIGLMAEFLPWMIVPRGTYIYHYFASIPFLVLCIMLMLHWLTERYPRVGKAVTAIYLVIALACFIYLFPYASGMPTRVEWLEHVRQHMRFLNVYYSL